VVGGAAAVLSRPRWLALAALGTALIVFGAVAPDLPKLPEAWAVMTASFVVIPAFTGTIWLAVPLAKTVRELWLLAGAALAGVAWVAFFFSGIGVASNTSKLVCFVLVGYWFLSVFEQLWWLTLVAIFVPWVDVWSVAAGPTRYVTEERPGFFEQISVALQVPGETGTANIGPPDITFFALFLAAAQRFRLRMALTWLAMTLFLGLTLVGIWLFDTSGLPALPAVCLGFVLPNADLLWRNIRDTYAAYAASKEEA
jgi:hypothetical protein